MKKFESEGYSIRPDLPKSEVFDIEENKKNTGDKNETEENNINNDQKKESKRIMDLFKSEVEAGRICVIKEDGRVRVGKKILNLGSEYSNHCLVKLDTDKYGIVKKDDLLLSRADLFVYDFSEFLTIGKDDKISIQPYSIEKFNPKRDGESDQNFYARTFFQKDSISNVRIERIVNILSNQSNLSLNDLNYRERAALATYYFSNGGAVAGDNLIFIAKEYGIEGLKTFLSCEYGMEMGNKIIGLAEKLPKKTAQKIFNKYYRIVKEVDQVIEHLEQTYGEKDYNDKTINAIRENLLIKAKDLLAEYSDITRREGEKIDPKEVEERIENIKTEVTLFASSYKTISKTEGVTLNEIKGIELTNKSVAEMTAEEKQEMINMFVPTRRLSYYPEALGESSIKGFEKSMATPDTKFYIYKQDGRIISFFRLDDMPNGNKYFGNFVVRKEAQESKIGTEILSSIVHEISSGVNIEADVFADNPIVKTYIEKFGFTITSIDREWKNTGQMHYHIIIDRKINDNLIGPKINRVDSPEFIRHKERNDFELVEAEMNSSQEERYRLLEPFLNQGYRVSRYLEDSNKLRMVLEKPIEDIAAAA